MEASQLSRRLILKFIPASYIGMFMSNPHATAQTVHEISAEAGQKAASASVFYLQLTSLIPKSKMPAALIQAKLGQTINVEPILDLPISLRVERDNVHSSKDQEFYTLQVLSASGTVLSETNIADRTSATFVDNRIQVGLTALN
jgi:hypothetical protein